MKGGKQTFAALSTNHCSADEAAVDQRGWDVCFCFHGNISYGAAMANFKSQIAHHRDKLNELHERIHSTFKVRERSESHRHRWEDACADFHNFRSEIDSYIDDVSAERLSEDKRIRQFVFDYLSVDPIYFRSGYQKENLLKLLKSLNLSDGEKDILRQTILRRVRNGALREFRRFCQLIPKIENDAFVDELRNEAKSTDAQIQRRATFALEYVAKKPSAGS
jgi:hypothetical protein